MFRRRGHGEQAIEGARIRRRLLAAECLVRVDSPIHLLLLLLLLLLLMMLLALNSSTVRITVNIGVLPRPLPKPGGA